MTEPLVDGLHRHSKVMQLCPGGCGLRIGSKNRAAKEVVKAAAVLADQLEAVGCDQRHESAAASPSHGWVGVSADMVDKISDRVRWILDPRERLIAVAYGSTSHWGWFTWGYSVFTDRRILFCRGKQFMSYGVVDRELPWSEVKKVDVSRGKGWVGGWDILLKHGSGQTRVESEDKFPDGSIARLARELDRTRASSTDAPNLVQAT